MRSRCVRMSMGSTRQVSETAMQAGWARPGWAVLCWGGGAWLGCVVFGGGAWLGYVVFGGGGRAELCCVWGGGAFPRLTTTTPCPPHASASASSAPQPSWQAVAVGWHIQLVAATCFPVPS